MKTNEAFPARETNPVDVAKLEGYKRKIAETSCAEVAGPDQPVVKQMRPGHFTNQIHPGFPGYPNQAPPPAGNTFARGLLMFTLAHCTRATSFEL